MLQWRDTGSLSKDRPGRQREGVALYMTEQLECMEVCQGMNDKPSKSLWLRIKEQITLRDIIGDVSCRAA